MTLDCIIPSTVGAPAFFGAPSEPPQTSSANELLPLLWSGLSQGSLVIAAADIDQHYARLTLRPSSRSAPQRPQLQRAAVALEAVLRGTPQKVIAMEQGVAFSTLSVGLRTATARMGLRTRFLRVPLGLPLLVQAVANPGLVSARVEGSLPSVGRVCTVVLQRTEPALVGVLSPSELAVASYVLEGLNYERIAVLRSAALRTIANQISAIGRKLNVRGRFDLLRASVECRRSAVSVTSESIPRMTPSAA
jgi:DNA-binding NarL/FixJ family response regulator